MLDRLPRLLGTALAATLIASAALADDASGHDLGWAVELAGEALAAAAIVLAGWALAIAQRWIRNRTGFDTSVIGARLDDALERAIERGVDYAVGELRGKVDDIQFDNRTVNLAADYVLQVSRNAVDHFGLQPDTVRMMIRARLARLLPGAPEPA